MHENEQERERKRNFPCLQIQNFIIILQQQLVEHGYTKCVCVFVCVYLFILIFVSFNNLFKSQNLTFLFPSFILIYIHTHTHV